MKTGLELLREPFPDNQIGKLPKPTKKQTDEVKGDYKKGIRCTVCKGWHHPKVVHLDYVGHAAITDRLLDCDINWSWEPTAFCERGLPLFDNTGGLWVRLTVCGVSRLGYGNAASSSFKDVGAREKECIGDALRNAAMRFGAALDLWHVGDLHVEDAEEEKPAKKDKALTKAQRENYSRLLTGTDTEESQLFSALNIASLDTNNYEKAMSALQKKRAKNAATSERP